jgi:hypothetical protein
MKFLPILIPFVAVCLFSSSCRRSLDKQVIGTWNWKGCDDAGLVVYQRDHKFVTNDWAVTYSQQPPIIVDGGDWKVSDNYLAMKFKGDSRPEDARDVRVRFVIFDSDTMVIRREDEKVLVFTRAK